MPAHRGGDEIEVHLGDLLRRGRDARLGQYLQPQAEAIRVELILLARPVVPPQVVVEDAHQLFGGGEADDLAAVFEAAVANELMQDPGIQALNDLGEVWRLQKASQKMARPSRIDGPCGHW